MRIGVTFDDMDFNLFKIDGKSLYKITKILKEKGAIEIFSYDYIERDIEKNNIGEFVNAKLIYKKEIS